MKELTLQALASCDSSMPIDEVVFALEENSLSYAETNRELASFSVSDLQLVILLP